MTVRTVIFGSVGILLALAALCLLVVWLGKKFPDERYDERQKIARGNAYRFSFWIGAVCYLAVMITMIYNVEHEPVVESYLLMYIAMGVQVLTFHLYCMVTHSALPFSEKPTVPIICYCLMGAMELHAFFRRGYAEILPLTGTGTAVWTDLIMGIFFLSLAAMHLISALIKERE